MATAWPLHGHYMAITWPLHGHRMAIAYPLNYHIDYSHVVDVVARHAQRATRRETARGAAVSWTVATVKGPARAPGPPQAATVRAPRGN
eukprot:1482646-Lingulodinium_polyedra.AAC.1